MQLIRRMTVAARWKAALAAGLLAVVPVAVVAKPAPAGATAGDDGALHVMVDTTIDTNTGLVTPGGMTVGHLVAGSPGAPSQRVIELTTLIVDDGATLRFVGAAIPFVTATGAVVVSGVVDVSATASAPGPGGGRGGTPGAGSFGLGGHGGGGHSGGAGGSYSDATVSSSGEAGAGAGGVPTACGGGGGFGGGGLPAWAGSCGTSSSTFGLVHVGGGGGGGGGITQGATDLQGGSGGGAGASTRDGGTGGDGGAGGGGLRVESATAITIDGSVLADGANGHPPIGFAGVSSGGGGGVLWLRAPTVAISGTVRAKGGDYVASARGADGTVVIDADCRTGEGVIYPEPTVGTFSGAAGVAVDDAYTTDEDTTLSVPAAGVLANDCGSSLSAVLVTGASHGAVSLQSDGLFDYTPASDWHGTDSLTYALSAGGVASGTATVTITVVSVNDAPVAAADAYTAQSGAALTVQSVLGVLANDSDVDGDPLTAALATNVAHGTLSLAPDGSFTYTSEPGFVGTDSFTYVASDGATSSATTTATINVTPPPSDLSATVQPPINADGTSVFAAKRGVVPVKFALHTGDGSATCDPPAATITVTRTGSGNATSVDEAVYTTPADSGSAFRVTGCQYIYNLDTKALGTGTYRVTILVNGHELGATTFAVK